MTPPPPLATDADDAAFFADLLESLREDEPHEPLPEPAGGDIELIDALCAPVLALDDGFSLDLAALEGGVHADVQVASDFQHISAAPALKDEGSSSEEAKKSSRGNGKAAAGDGKTDKPKTKRRIRRSNPNKAREEQRKELLALRVQAAEMEQQLSSMRSAGGLAALTNQPTDATAGQLAGVLKAGAMVHQQDQHATSIHVDFTEVWRQTCLRQLERRLRAERENTKLKEQLSNQSRATSAIHKMLQGPAGANVPPDVFTKKRTRSFDVPPSDPVIDQQLYAQLFAEADAAFFNANRFLEDNGLLNFDGARHGMQMRESDGRLVLDVFAASVVPFDWRFSGQCAWRFYKGTQKHHGPFFDKMAQSIGMSEDMVIENFVTEITANNASADFRVRQVVKRYAQENQQVIVWRDDCQPIEYRNKSTNFGFRETGYVVCRAPCGSAGTSDSTPPVTVMQVGYRISPYMMGHSGRPLRANISDIAQFVFTMLNEEIHAILERLENLLIDEKRRR